MDFRVLGPLQAVVNGADVDVRGAKERVLLAHLVAYAGRAVPTADLIESLWRDRPPRTATKSLQTYVLRLRNALEPDRTGAPRLLVTEGAGYRLAITARDTDAGRFGRLVEVASASLAAGRPQSALEAAQDALALWRGPAYAGCEDTVFGPAEARRLDELRLSAEEIRLEAMLAVGQERAAAPELERLVAAHPLREHLWELLMLALYRSGRQGAALEAYDRVRAVLATELGVDPGAALRELHARVLAQDPQLDRTGGRSEIPASLRRTGPDPVGREAELQVLRDLWARTVAGASTAALVRGPVGAGATTLASMLAASVAGDGHPVLTGDQHPPPRGPWLRVVDGEAAAEADAMVLALGGPEAQPPDDGVTVVDLEPLDAADVRRVVAAYVDPEAVDETSAAVLASGTAWPGRVHAEAARLSREAAGRRLADAVEVVGESSAVLTSARADVADSIVTLGRSATDAAIEPGVCPWRGLASYAVEDAPWFAGREHLVAELLARLASTRLLAVVGASGSGKSSAVHAGMLAALADDVLPGSAGWRQVVMRPGPHPMRELTRAALGHQRGEVSDLLAQLIRLEGEEQRSLLVVDQMEETWTACSDEGERAAFLDTLVDVATDPRSRVTVVLAIRADYVGEAAEHPGLTALMADGTVLVGSPTPAELGRAISHPAARAGLDLEEGLAETIVSDAGTEPGLLPLLSVALTQVWAQRDGNRLTFAGYVETGGIAGAIGTLAEDVWTRLDADEQDTARVLLLRLTGPGEGTGVVRRRVPVAEIEALGRPSLRRVVNRLAEARLITLGDAHVEVAHEALMREWPRLRGWLADDRAGRAVQRRLALAAAEWDAEGRDPAMLWRGTRLLSGQEVAAARPEEVTPLEAEFLAAGQSAVDADQAATRARAETTARQNRRLRWLLGALAGLLALALLAGVLALAARGQAEQSAEAAETSARRADARALAADALNEDRPALALLQAVEATKRDAAPETYGALLTLLTRAPDALTRVRIPDRFLRIAPSADGSTVYLSDNTEVVRAVDTTTAEVLWETPTGDGQWGDAVQNTPGAPVAVPMLGDPEAGVLGLLDPDTGEVRHTVTADDLLALAPTASTWVDESVHPAAEGRAVVLTTETHAFVIDPATGRVLRARAIPAHPPYSIALPNGRIAFQEEPSGTVLVDPLTGRTDRREGMLVGVDAGGRRLLTASTAKDASGTETSELTLRRPDWRPVGRAWQVPGFVRGAEFVPGRAEVAVALEETLVVYDLDSHALLRDLDVHSGALLQMALAGPDRDLLWTAGRDGTAVAIDTSGTRGLLRRLPTHLPGESAAVAGGRAVVMNLEEVELNTASVLDLRRSRVIAREILPFGDCTCQAGQVAITPDGGLGLVAGLEHGDDGPVLDRGHVVVLDTADGRTVRTLETPWEASGLGASPDARHVLVNGSGGWGLWNLATGEQVWRHDDVSEIGWAPGSPLVGFSPDGATAALARNEEVVLVDVETGEVRRRAELPGSMVAGRLLFNASGDTLVVGSMSGRLYFLDADSLERTAPDRLVTAGYVLDAVLSASGRMLAVMGSDGDVTLFDTGSWKPYGKPVVDKLGWGFLEFVGDDVLRIRGELGADYEIDTDPRAWVEAACRSANTAFTREESALILPGEPVGATCG